MAKFIMLAVEKFIRYFLFSLLFVANTASLQPIERAETKEKLTSALTLNFIRHIAWPNEREKAVFSIVFLGNDQAQFETIKELSAFQVRNTPISVEQVTSIDKAINKSLVLVGEDFKQALPLLNAQIARMPTLVVAINAADKQHFGVNIVYTQQGVSFEVNRYNLLYQGLQVDRSLFLLGGTDLDIAELLKEMELELASGREDLMLLQKQVNAQMAVFTETEQQLSLSRQQQLQLQITLDNKIQQQSELETSFSQLNIDYQNQLQELQHAQNLLDAKQEELKGREQSLADLSAEIDKDTALLAALKNQTDEQQKELLRRNALLNRQETVIDKQALRLQTLGLLLLAFFFLIGLIFWSLRKQYKLNRKLSSQNISLENLNQDLKNTQAQLIESEKLSALGRMVAGIAHEINTPLGICVTASSHMSEKSKEYKVHFESGKLKKSQLQTWLDVSENTSKVILNNVKRAADLVRSFKQVSADQISDERRKFNLLEYLQDISSNMSPLLSKHGHTLSIDCDKDIELDSFPGVLSQILNNLVLNSIQHGFKQHKGKIKIEVSGNSTEQECVILNYTDDGSGISEENIKQVFEPFFTTERGDGNTGLGMHISYNLALSIGSNLSCLACAKGVHFKLTLLKYAKHLITELD